MEGGAVAARRAGCVEVVRSPQDRVVGIADVASQAVGAPGGREELHRPARAGRAVAPQPVEPGLDEIDGGEDTAADAEATLGGAVVAKQPSGRRSAAGPEAATAARRRQPDERPAGGHQVAGLGRERAWQEADHTPRQARAIGEEDVNSLVIEGPQLDLARRAPV